MANSSLEPRVDTPLEETSKLPQSRLPSSNQQSQPENDQKPEGNDHASQHSLTMSSSDDSTCDHFAQTRSPFSVEESDQPTKYCFPYVEDCEDSGSETHTYSDRRISPFAAEFMSADAGSTVFGKGKAGRPKKVAKALDTIAKPHGISEQSPSSPEHGDSPPANGKDGGPLEPATCQEKPVSHNSAEEVSEGYAMIEIRDLRKHLVDIDLQEAEGATEFTSPRGLLTILDEDIDQQFADKAFASLEPDSADSSSLTILALHDLEEHSLWSSNLDDDPEEFVNESTTIEVDATALTIPPDTDEKETSENSLVSEDQDTTSGDTSDRDAAAFTKSQPSDSAAALLQHIGEQYSETPILPSPNASTGYACPRNISCGLSRHTSVSISSLGSPNKVVSPFYTSQLESLQITNTQYCEEYSLAQGHLSQPQDLEAFAETPEAEKEGSHQSVIACYEADIYGTKSRSPSVVSSESYRRPRNNTPNTTPEPEEHVSSPARPGQPVHINTLVSQTLQDFKADLLQHFESVLDQSAKALIPARNSAAATILARSLPLEMEKAIKSEICTALNVILEEVDQCKTETIGQAFRLANTATDHSVEIMGDLKKKLIEHVDKRFEGIEKIFVAFESDLSQSSTQSDAHLKTIITELLPSEGLATLQKLPAIVDQLQALEVSKKLDQYAAKTQTVSNLCTRLDETITSQQSRQNDILTNLCSILSQSTLQNNAINELATTVHPLAKLVQGISYDTNLIDAKLVKNADILTAVTDRTEALEEAAAKFERIMYDAEGKLKKATSKMEKAAKNASAVNAMQAAGQYHALQEQMAKMQAQLDAMTDAMAKGCSANGGNTHNASTSADSNTVSHEIANNVPLPPSPGPVEHTTNPPEPTTDTILTRAKPTDPQPSPPKFTIKASFQLPNNKHIDSVQTFTLPISESDNISTFLHTFHNPWTQELLDHGIIAAKLELVSIWELSVCGARRRVIDNDMAYQGWYKAVAAGKHRSGRVLHFEFLDCAERESEGSGSGIEEPRHKKRKQEEVRVVGDEEVGVEFSLDVWRNARQTKFGRPAGYAW